MKKRIIATILLLSLTVVPSLDIEANNASSIPSSYSSDNVTSVKDCGSYGTSWAFAALGAGEASMLAQGYVDAEDDIDFSEWHLLWFFYNNVVDPLGNLDGDSTEPVGAHYLNVGGDNWYSMFALAQWRGAADEDVAPYEDVSPEATLDNSLAYENIAHMQNTYIVSMQDTDAVKQLIMSYGAVATAMFVDDRYYNSTTEAYYQNVYENSNQNIMLVGWDDNFAVNNFSEDAQPSNPGAWLVKNCCGTDMDYFWISYEDLCVSQEDAFAFIFEPADNYDFNYQYDGTSANRYMYIVDGEGLANVFTASGAGMETIDAVSIALKDDNIKYSIQIYLNPEDGDPLSGTPLLSEPQTGTTTHMGYHTIKLNEKVTVEKGDKFAVYFTMEDTDEDDNTVDCFIDMTTKTSWIFFESHAEPNQMYYYNAGKMVDLYGISYSSTQTYGDVGVCPRIKAFTSDVTSENLVQTGSIGCRTDIQLRIYRSCHNPGTCSIISGKNFNAGSSL